MRDFPAPPDELFLMPLGEETGNVVPCLGKVVLVLSRNPDPGVTVGITTREDFETHVGGAHSEIKLTIEDSMRAVVLFAKANGTETKIFTTYELEGLLASRSLARLGPDTQGIFEIILNFLLQTA